MEALHGQKRYHFLSSFVQRRREMGHPVLTKGFFTAKNQKQPCYLGPVLKPAHLLSPFLLVQNLSPNDIAGSDITS